VNVIIADKMARFAFPELRLGYPWFRKQFRAILVGDDHITDESEFRGPRRNKLRGTAPMVNNGARRAS